MVELSILQAISAGGNVAIMALLVLHWKQAQCLQQLKIEIVKLETKLSMCKGCGNDTK